MLLLFGLALSLRVVGLIIRYLFFLWLLCFLLVRACLRLSYVVQLLKSKEIFRKSFNFKLFSKVCFGHF